MLGSSSTTRIFSLTCMCLPLFPAQNQFSGLIHRQQKRESTSSLRFALYPNLSPVRLNQPFRNRQSQAHTRGVPVNANEVLKNFLVMFRRNPCPGVRNAYFHAVWSRQAESPAFFY